MRYRRNPRHSAVTAGQIKHYYATTDLYQYQIAALVGVSGSFVSQVIRGRRYENVLPIGV